MPSVAVIHEKSPDQSWANISSQFYTLYLYNAQNS